MTNSKSSKAEATITAVKSLTGRALKNGEFSFTLTAKDDAPMPEGAENGTLTVTNQGTKVDFGSISYDKAGTYKYTINEVKGNLSGITYDETIKHVTVTVAKNDAGKLTAVVTGDGAEATFENTYSAKEAEATITAMKSLTGRNLKDGEFSFTLTAKDNAPMPEGAENGTLTITNKGSEVNFGSIIYKKAGTYDYTIKEVKGDLGGITYDESTKNITVTVTDNLDGTMSAKVVGDGEAATFTNSYSTAMATASISAKKVLKGRDLNDDEFSFTLTAEDNAPMPDGSKDGSKTVTNKGQAVNFGSIEYTKAGTYKYIITEVKGDLGGITYDESTKNITVTVTDNLDGTMSAKVTGDGDDATFTNTYNATKTTASISAKKVLNGRNLKNDEFSFTLTAVKNAPMPEGSKGGSKTVTNKGQAVNFGSIEYTKAGTYTYKINEVKGSLGGVKYDESVKTVTVTVTDNSDGTMSAKVAGDGDDATFTNTYSAAKTTASISAKKVLNGRDLNDEEFRFTLSAEDNAPMPEGSKDGSKTVTNKGQAVNFGSIEYTKAGTYKYTITEVKGELGGITYDESTKNITVTVTDNLDGTMSAKVAGDGDDATFTNTYSAAKTTASISAKKILNGRDLNDDEFSFTLTAEDNAPMPDGSKDGSKIVTNKGQTVNFGSIEYTKAGTYKYTITEVKGDLGGITYDESTKNITVTVTDNLDGTMTAAVAGDGDDATFTNTYNATKTTASISAKKVLNGRNLKNDEFSFTLTAVKNAPMPEGSKDGSKTVTNKGKTVNFGSIEYTKAGTYTYKINEVKGSLGGVKYDESVKTVIITVTDNSDGTMTAAVSGDGDDATFTNTYSAAKATASISAKKVLNGRNLKNDEFSFTLTAVKNAPMPEGSKDGSKTVTNKGQAVNFGTIEYTKAGTYTYTITEVKGELGGVIYDDSIKNVTVTVKDNLDGTMTASVAGDGAEATFENTYSTKKTEATIKAVKSLTGRDLKDGEFQFTLTAKKNAPMPEGAENGTLTVTNKGSEVNFGSIIFDKAGTYNYTINEVKGNLGGVTYDESTKTVTVIVKDNLDGTMTASVDGDGAEATFRNTYSTKETEATITAKKSLTGRDLKDGEFQFTLTAKKNAPMPEKAEDGKVTASNDAEGNISFGKITYTKAGTYEYTINEVKGNFGGVTYDESTKNVTVTVKDNLDGTLTASVDGDGAEATFKNTYSAKEAEATITAVKSLTGRDLKNHEFRFTLTAKDDAPMPEGAENGTITVTNQGTEVNFGSISYDQAGIYYYTIEEVKGNLGGITYDKDSKNVTVTVKDNLDGTMTAAVAGDGADAIFMNKYEASGSITFAGTKTVENAPKGMTPAGYMFVVTDNNDTTQTWTATSNADGTISYPKINYTLADVGTHTYKVTETNGNQSGITYDETSYEVTVEVSDHGDGTLDITASENADALNFTNTYEAEGYIVFTGHKTLKGGNLTDGQFSFEVKEGNNVVATAVNKADGTVNFPAITYTQDQVGEHTYIIAEVKDTEKDGIIYSDQTYTVKVNVTDNGDGTLTADVTDGNVDNLNFTNEVEKTSVSVKKAWADSNNQDGKRTDSVKVQLYADGSAYGDPIVLNAGNSWAYTWTDLNKISDGNEVKYTVDEIEIPDGYKRAISGSASDGYIITNTHKPETTSISGTKTWDDNNNQDGKRPESITINLLADGEKYKSATITGADNWMYEFKDLPVYKNGTEIKYTVAEENVEGYEATVDGYNITNTHKPETIEVSGTKTWDDHDNQDGVRPDSITINLLANGKKINGQEVTAAADWKYTFTNLPKYSDGKEITYTVTEEKVEGYEAAVDGFNITNTHKPETIEISGTKTWDDSSNQDGRRPESITIHVLADGVETASKTMTAADGWTYRFTDLPKFSNGKEIQYTITEDAVDDYSTKINGYDVTNSYTPGKTSVTVTKAWDDGSNQDGKRPESIDVQLYADGAAKGDKVTLSESNGWTYTWTDLDEKKNEGETIAYTAREVSDLPDGYSSEIVGDAGKGYTITNSYTPETVDVNGTKTWADNRNQDGKRPASITVRLYQNGTEIDSQTVTGATDADTWSYSFTGLPRYENGSEITYTVKEDPVPGYTTTVNGYNIVNTYTPELVTIKGTKTWVDDNDADGIRPKSIIVNLLADGKFVEKQEVKAAADGTWTYAFLNLPAASDGKKIVYTVTEEPVTGYTTEITGYDIINTHHTEKIDIPVTKVWEGGASATSVEVELVVNGNAAGNIMTLSASNNWQGTFTDLDKYADDGSEIEYTVQENTQGFVTTIEGSAADGFTITNRPVEDNVTDLHIHKYWADSSDVDGFRPTSVQIQIYADGEPYGGAVTLSEDNGWTYDLTNIPAEKDGETITYTVEEVSVPEHYASEVSASGSNTFNITNIREENGTWETNDGTGDSYKVLGAKRERIVKGASRSAGDRKSSGSVNGTRRARTGDTVPYADAVAGAAAAAILAGWAVSKRKKKKNSKEDDSKKSEYVPNGMK